MAPDGSSLDAYRRRRKRIGERVGNGALVLFGGLERTRSHDTEYRFRPDSNFFYLTGLSEPGAVMVLRPGRDPELVLFVRARDVEAEIWTGRRHGPEGARERFAADDAHPLDKLAEVLPKLLDGVDHVYAPLGEYPDFDRALLVACDALRRGNRLGRAAPGAIHDARALLGEDRIVKDAAALASLRHAVDVTVAAHIEAMSRVRPGLHEYEVEALLEYFFRRSGGSGPGYASIVGSGDNANILHYIENSGDLHAGDLLLVDAGAEWDFFSGDLTRTYPVSGRFTPAQRDLYQVVLAANQAGIAATCVGADIDAIHLECVRILCQGLRDLGLLEGEVDGLVESQQYKRYYMHRTSHWLGADVHDAGHYCIAGKPRPLQAGFVLTIEPALYVRADDEGAPPALRGCGIRIEDDVLVRDEGPEILSHAAPKTVEELESIVGSRAQEPLALR